MLQKKIRSISQTAVDLEEKRAQMKGNGKGFQKHMTQGGQIAQSDISTQGGEGD